MKNLIITIIITITFSACSVKNINYDVNKYTEIHTGYFYKIDSLNKFYIYHFRSDSIEGVFTKPKNKNFNNPSFQQIKLNTKYKLILNRQLYANHVNGLNLRESIYEDNVLIWETGMKSQYFTDCKNIIGDKINTKFTIKKD